ncbi:SurA N-terminal domain-containing protein [Candidatus Giovannonibacteria bacterium]|nr:SurA N-terminal domain-containing protein [Candidatus Giovannonibacteria bacterium]
MKKIQKILKGKYLAVGAVVVILVAVFFSWGYLPVMKVNGEMVSYRTFSKILDAMNTYDKAAGKAPLAEAEMKRKVFSDLVEQKFLDETIAKTDPAMEKEAEALVEQAIKDTPGLNTKDASRLLFSLSEKDFKHLVLLPQAKRDVVMKRFETNPDFPNMWSELYKNAQVSVYYPGFYWEEGEIKSK